MTGGLLELPVGCPYCGEGLVLLVDVSAGESDQIEDCPVCCRPMGLRLGHTGEEWSLEARRDDE